MQGNLYSTFSEEEHENMAHQETNHDKEATTNEDDIDYYCKHFANFMQAQPHWNYDLISSRKRLRELEQQERTSPQVIPPVLDKGKGNFNPDSSKIKFSSSKERNNSEEHAEKEAHALQKTASGKEGEAKLRSIEKVQPTFNL